MRRTKETRIQGFYTAEQINKENPLKERDKKKLKKVIERCKKMILDTEYKKGEIERLEEERIKNEEAPKYIVKHNKKMLKAAKELEHIRKKVVAIIIELQEQMMITDERGREHSTESLEALKMEELIKLFEEVLEELEKLV